MKWKLRTIEEFSFKDDSFICYCKEKLILKRPYSAGYWCCNICSKSSTYGTDSYHCFHAKKITSIDICK